MKINILLPYKEKFDENKASSVSITVKNNLFYSRYLNEIKIFGQKVENPLFKDNFFGFKHSFLSLKSKNKFLAKQMLKVITQDTDLKQLIEIHNRPYLVDQIAKEKQFPISLFFHNDPQEMKGSKSIKDRENILQKSTAIFCVSKYIKNRFLDGIYTSTKKVHVLYNGVDRKIKLPTKRKKEIIFVGRIVEDKGVDLYVDVVSKLAKEFPDWNFALIGSYRLGEKNNNSYALNVIKKFQKIGNQAKFHGFQNHKFVQKKMENSSIIVIPSLWGEPFGLVAAEAMSNGIAIIASKTGALPEIVGRSGILLDGIDHIKLRMALKNLIVDKEKRENLQKLAWNNFKLSSRRSSKALDNYRKQIFREFF